MSIDDLRPVFHPLRPCGTLRYDKSPMPLHAQMDRLADCGFDAPNRDRTTSLCVLSV